MAAGSVLFSNGKNGGKIGSVISDWTNWTFWVTTLALVAFGFCLRVLYERWYFRKVRNEARDEVRDLTRRLETATERLNKANADTVSKSH
jgi:hypothetical protein